jgi:hypothetical protein
MRYLISLLGIVIVIISCGQNNISPKPLLKDWILANEKELIFQSDSFSHDYRNGHPEPDWLSADLAIANSMTGPLGQLADKAGDSTNCIVVVLTIFKDTSYKRRIFLVATDSSCLKKLNTIELPTDSTQNIVFGKSEESLQ